MKSKIHYEDDLFFLNLQIRLIREGFKLTIDAEYYLEKIFSDLRFIDSALDSFFMLLKDNPNLIRRAEYFYHLTKVQTAFVELLQGLQTVEHPFHAALEAFQPEAQAILEAHQADLLEIQTLLKLNHPTQEAREDFITPDELSLLTSLGPGRD